MIPSHIELHLNLLGVLPRPAARPAPQPATPRPDPSKSAGVWYPDGDVPF
jgi:hypothetical protein